MDNTSYFLLFHLNVVKNFVHNLTPICFRTITMKRPNLSPRFLKIGGQQQMELLDDAIQDREKRLRTSPSIHVEKIENKLVPLYDIYWDSTLDFNLMNDHETLEWLECAICKNILKKPQSLPCQHMFCKKCIKTHINIQTSQKPRCPSCRQEFECKSMVVNMVAAGLVNVLKVRCPHPSCEWKGQFGSLKSSHLINDCNHLILCECKMLIEKDKIIVHNQTCPKAKISCECGSKLERKRIKEHLETDCGNVLVSCTFHEKGCTWTGQRIFIKNHLTECPIRSLRGKIKKLNRKIEELEKQANEQKLLSKLNGFGVTPSKTWFEHNGWNSSCKNLSCLSFLLSTPERMSLKNEFGSLDQDSPLQLHEVYFNGSLWTLKTKIPIFMELVLNKGFHGTDLLVFTFGGDRLDRLFIIPNTSLTKPQLTRKLGFINIDFPFSNTQFCTFFAHRVSVRSDSLQELPYILQPTMIRTHKIILKAKGKTSDNVYANLSSFFSSSAWNNDPKLALKFSEDFCLP